MKVVVVLGVVLCAVRGENEQQYEYLVEGVVQFRDVVNFIEPLEGSEFSVDGVENGRAQNVDFYGNSYVFYGSDYGSRRLDEEPSKTQSGENSGEEIIQITQEIPVPYPVKIEKTVHYPVPVPVEQPVAVHVPKPYPVRVERKVRVPVPVPVPKPFPVHKTIPVPVQVPVDNPVPYAVYKPVPFYVQRNVPFRVFKHVPFQVEVPVGVNKEVQIPVPVDKKVPLYVPRPVPYEVKVLIDKPYTAEVPVPYEVKLENQDEMNTKVQSAMAEMLNGANVLFQKSFELPTTGSRSNS